MKPNTHKFSEFSSSDKLMNSLALNSRSNIDAQLRLQAYSKAFSNLDDLSAQYYQQKRFSNTGIGDLAGMQPNQFIDVTVSTMLRSIVPFLSIERGLDSPRATLPFLNLKSTYDGSMVSPNLGPDTGLASAEINYQDNNATGKDYQFLGGTPLVPGSVKITVNKGTDNFTIIDDGKGSLLAPSVAKMELGKVNYKLGNIEFKFTEELGAGGNWYLNAAKDTPMRPDNRVKGEADFYELTTYPQTIVAENNLVTNMVAQKSMGINMQTILKKRVAEEYLKMKNASVVDAIVNGYTGDTLDVDLSRYDIKTNNFESFLQLFTLGLTQVDTELTSKSWKSVNSSAYLVGSRVAELFKACSKEGTFVPNANASYIDDLMGYFNGIPVIRSHKVPATDGYAIHKTVDGTLAPVAYGIFLPVNDLPEVGNFANPTQSASGIFSYEGVKLIAPELIQKFTIKLPVGTNTIRKSGSKVYADYAGYLG